MSQALAENLSPRELTGEKVKQLLAAAGAESADDAKQNVEAFEYDWRQPRYFSREQLTKLKYFAENISTVASEKFTQLFQSDFHVTTDSTSQHFADEFIRQNTDNENPDFFLLFGAAPNQTRQKQAQPCGLVGIPHETALVWTTQSLGRANSDEDPGRSLSQLESSLLLDAAALFVEALSNSCDDQTLHVIGDIVSGRLPLDAEDTKEMCKITFNTQKADSQDDPAKAFLLMPCEKLGPVAKIIEQTVETLSPEDASKAIVAYLHQMPILVTAQLGSASIVFGELMNLAVNDVLVLDMKVSEPVKLIVDGIELFNARPAKSDGKYAVAITQSRLRKQEIK